MATELSTIEANAAGQIIPRNVQQIMDVARVLCASGYMPYTMNKPEQVAIAIMHGMEIGLPTMASVQSIAVINGRPSLWGDAVLALVEASGLLDDFEETLDDKTMTATCRAVRKGRKSPIVRTFSREDAQQAGLWDERIKVRKKGKDGNYYEGANDSPWFRFRKDMLAARARGRCLRAGFSDVLKGLAIAEEMQDVIIIDAEAIETAPKNTSAPNPDNDTTKGSKVEATDSAPKPPRTQAESARRTAEAVSMASAGGEAQKYLAEDAADAAFADAINAAREEAPIDAEYEETGKEEDFDFDAHVKLLERGFSVITDLDTFSDVWKARPQPTRTLTAAETKTLTAVKNAHKKRIAELAPGTPTNVLEQALKTAVEIGKAAEPAPATPGPALSTEEADFVKRSARLWARKGKPREVPPEVAEIGETAKGLWLIAYDGAGDAG